MINLLKETKIALRNHRMSLNSIRYIRNKEGRIPVADFVEAAEKINYDNKSGEVEIDPTLTLCGSHWWMERISEGGREGWVFRHKPKEPELIAWGFNLQEKRIKPTIEEIIEKKEEKII